VQQQQSTRVTLGQKHRLDASSPWEAARHTASATVDWGMLNAKIDRVLTEARQKARTGHVGYGWSGGKDAQVLRWLMEQAGVTRSVLGVTRDLEFPAMVRWFQYHAPADCDLIEHPVIDLRWLRAHPHMLFTRDERATYWYEVHRRAWKQFARYEQLTVLALGRRRKDDNYVGPRGSLQYADPTGLVRWSPIGDWTHEEVFALIEREQLELPPCYEWPRGYRVGTGQWACREPEGQPTLDDPHAQWMVDVENGFRECWAIDAQMIRDAARTLPLAAEWVAQQDRA